MGKKRESVFQRLKRWYVEGLTGELEVDFKEFSKRKDEDIKELLKRFPPKVREKIEKEEKIKVS